MADAASIRTDAASVHQDRYFCAGPWASGRNEFTGTTDFQSVAWCYSTDWKSVVQIANGKFYPAARLSTRFST